ncbi:unannotated protein [freshwater metagenome]|uniref:Unannotated protein n=1 Tax=freshwater metagenome TaxID=449393 RepID=A0A6J7SM42_9ZZZZ
MAVGAVNAMNRTNGLRRGPTERGDPGFTGQKNCTSDLRLKWAAGAHSLTKNLELCLQNQGGLFEQTLEFGDQGLSGLTKALDLGLRGARSCNEPHDGLCQSALACLIGAENRDEFTIRQSEVEIGESTKFLDSQVRNIQFLAHS